MLVTDSDVGVGGGGRGLPTTASSVSYSRLNSETARLETASDPAG